MPTEYDPEEADLGLASLVAGWALADALTARLAADGYDDVRFADGVVFQHLVGAPMAIGDLAGRLGVTQQAVSKTVADLARRGYVERADHADRRRHLVALTERAEVMMARSREHRAAIDAELEARLGARRVATARRVLLEAVTALGGEDALRGRRLRPPR